ncbi:unnamed protein product [Paramecium sonneborni]|uniref:Uncharacterized protein n=1 Tax=Paramecium sonneborni TaxID=65129 RepID=A0A8S1KRC3_9CILI|nr:unnamed protein product [Paramecium sonneborni]
MQQNSSFDGKVGMEIENQTEFLEQSKDSTSKQKIYLYQTPPKQEDLKIEKEMEDVQSSPHFKKEQKNQTNLPEFNLISGKKNATKENQDQFQKNIQNFSEGQEQFTPNKIEFLFQGLNNLLAQAQERIQNQSQISLCTNDLSQCYGTYSEIKQQISEIEKVYRYKDDELFQLNIQLEKEFNICKNQKIIDSATNSQMNQSFDIHKRYQQIQEIKKNKLYIFKKKYQENYNQLRQDFNDLKNLTKEMFQIISFNIQECKMKFNQKIETKSQKIEKSLFIDYQSDKLEEDYQQKSSQQRDDEHIDNFIQELMKLLNISKEDYENIEDLKLQIVNNVKEQKNYLEIIQTNQNLSVNQKIIKLNTTKDELQNELVQLNQQKEQQQKILDQNRIEIQNLQQKLEQLEKRDYIDLNTKLFQHEQIQMEQQQQLISISLIIIQQLFQSTSFESSLKKTFSEKNQYLNTYFKEAKKIIYEKSWPNEVNPLKYLQLHQQKVQEIMNIFYTEYSKMISWIQQQRENLIKQL